VFGPAARAAAAEICTRAVDEAHAKNPLREGVARSSVRDAFPRWSPGELADATLAALIGRGDIEAIEGGVRRPGHSPTLSPSQDAASRRLRQILEEGELSAPALSELPEDLRDREDLWALLRRLEAQGSVRRVTDELFLCSDALDRAGARIRAELGGRRDVGPAGFKDVLPVTRKRLLPLLGYYDRQGITLRRGEGRDVPQGG
jgi:selenocysteine-specific elongation factor